MAEQVTMEAPRKIPQLRRSPLAHLQAQLDQTDADRATGAGLREVPFLTMIGLRVDPGSDQGKALAAAAGVPLPVRCGEVGCGEAAGSAGGEAAGSAGEAAGTGNGPAILWQGPDEFLLVAPEDTVAVEDLVRALGDAPGAVVDLSANRTTLELSGPAARLVLEKGCPLDLHPPVFGPGTAVSTLLGPVPVLLWQTDDAPTYRILPRASFADYVARWLLDAMAEFRQPAPHRPGGS